MTDSVRVELGRVVGAHALAGEVRVRFFGDGPENLLGCPFVFLGDHRDDPSAARYAVRGGGQGRGGEVRLSLAGVDDRAAGDALRGRLGLVAAGRVFDRPREIVVPRGAGMVPRPVPRVLLAPMWW